MDSQKELNRCLDKRHALLFGVRKSIRYHNHRLRFFGSFYTVFPVIAFICGLVVLTTFFYKGPSFITAASCLVATTLVLFMNSIINRSSKKTELYINLSTRFAVLEKEIVSSLDRSLEVIKAFEAKRLDIEMEEPPILRVLNARCHNEMLRAMGRPESEFLQLGFFQHLMSQIMDVNADKISPAYIHPV